MKTKDTIQKYAFEHILQEGIRRTTVEKLAGELGISKNTIYKYFPTKDDLIKESFIYFTRNVKKNFKAVTRSDLNAIEKLVNWFNFVSSQILKFNDKFLIDVQIHYPEIWKSIDKFRKKMAYQEVTKLIEQGKKEKIFIDYPTNIVVTLFIGAFRAVITPDFILNNNYSVKEVFTHTSTILFNTILSNKGKILLKKLKLPQ